MNRSPNGCWTCRIRHRKCDEVSPACRECTDRGITCHGYGRKPAWVDDATRLREELARIKRAVNDNFRRTRRKQQQRRRSSGSVPQDHEPSPAVAAPTPSAITAVGTGASHETSFREAQLLIHYLDYIFPMQYPYYRDDPALGGRGWLFWLLMKRGPLHQAVLTLAALHHHVEFAHAPEREGSEDRDSELLGYHTNALQRLRQVISECDAERLPRTASSSSSFSRAARRSSASSSSRAASPTGSLTTTPSSPSSTGSLPRPWRGAARTPTSRSSAVSTSRSGFLVTKVVWLDVLAATVTGTAPRTRYAEWLDVEGVDMSRVMGCRNWAMRAIGDLASVAAEGDADGELDGRAIDRIKKWLEEGLNALDTESESSPPISDALTKVFASAALVQLQTTVPGTSLAEATVHNAVSRVIDALRELPSWVAVRGLAWPIAVAGSVATAGEQQAFFEDLMRQRVLDGSGGGFTNCGTVLRVLGHCWEHAKQWPGETWTWRDGMADMGICALLI
ncbi:hypothetical protein ACCO45_000417 [Purpureocillium lilacinum]|uniref:Uncharacterized protein n=1 Tax=Purpureocillium lilacinum TaxID=33203 RepID=A0ACC4E7C3_PURLI